MNTEINERIEREIFGRDWCIGTDYSGSIAAAWLVVEELEKQKLYRAEITFDHGQWSAWFYGDHYGSAENESLPLAICHAALDIVAKIKEQPCK